MRRQVMAAVSLITSGAALAVCAYLFFLTGHPADALAPALIFLSAVVGHLMVRTGRDRYAPHLLVAAVLAAATLAAIAYGSVRWAGAMLFLGAVAGAGIFTGRVAAILTTIASVLLIAALTLAERLGWMAARSEPVGLPALVTYIACIVVVSQLIRYSRTRHEKALEQLAAELEVRHRAEQERDRLIRRFSRMFHASPSPMVAQSAISGVILDVNPAFERAYGYTRDQMLGRTDHFFWADARQRAAHARRLLAERRILEQEIDAVHADGRACRVAVSSELSDEEGDRLVISTLTDVTEQRRMLDQLRRSQERFSKAFNFSPLNMTITRLSDGAFIEVNQAEDRVQGYRPEELAGKTSVGAGAWLSAEDRAAFIGLLKQEGRVHAYDTVMRHKDGRLRETRLWAERIEVDGEDCILSCTVDVSEEKRRERQLFEMARGMTGSSAADFFVSLTVHMAKALEADMTCVAELTSDGQLTTLAAWRDGQTISNYVYPLQGTPCGEASTQTGLCVFAQDLDLRFAHREGLVRGGFKSYIGQRLQDENGQPVGMIYAMWRQPLTLQRDAQSLVSIFASRANAELLRLHRDREIQALNATLEQRVQARTADLIKLNAELDSFAYSVSHDLKSPLRSIDGFTRLLSEQLQGRMQPDEAAMMQRILGATARMSTLIADLLALARVSQGPLERQPVDLSSMVDDILDTEMQRHPDRRLERRITPGLRVHCDPKLTRIALENLVGNALKYTRTCDPAVIEFGRSGADELYLRDNGVGFDMAYADKLFKPFERLHMPSQFEGTGIGLATVRRIVERHGGAVVGRGVPGGGAEFRFGFGPATLSSMETPSTTGAAA